MPTRVGKGATVLTVVSSEDCTSAAVPAAAPVGESLIDEIVRDGVRRMLAVALGAEAVGLAMAVKLIEAAQHRWRAVNAPQLIALVRAGARFEYGKLVERPAKVAA